MATPFPSRGLLPFSNPVSQFVDPRRNALMGFSAGMLSGNPGAAMTGAMQGAQLDQQYAQDQMQFEQDQQAKNSTLEWLKQQGHSDLVAGVEGGGIDMGTAWSEALKRSQPGYGQPELTADMRNFQFAQSNPDFAAFIGGSSGQAPQIVEIFDPQTGQPVKGYMQGNEFVPVGGAKQPSARDNPMNSTIQKEIFEADDAVLAGESVVNSLGRALELNQTAFDGPFAEQRAYGAAMLGDQAGRATLQLKNEVTSQALDQLKAIFGGMPTEGERKILLEIQGSADQPRAVREAIYKRAIEAANRRIAANRQKAGALRSGTYFDPSYGQQPANVTSGGVQWSIEP